MNSLMNISVDVDEQAVAHLVNQRIRLQVEQDIDFLISETVTRSISPYVRKRIEDVVKSEEFKKLLEEAVGSEVALRLSGDALTKLVLNKAFKSAIHIEAGKAHSRSVKGGK